MARFPANGPFSGLAPSLVTAQHSQIQQEANYVQERITAAKSLARKINAEVRRIEDKIKQARHNSQPRTMIDEYKKSLRRHRSRLSQCERNRTVWENRLGGIGVEMRILEQKQWRHNSAPELARVGPLHRNNMTSVPQWQNVPIESGYWIPPSLQTYGPAAQMVLSQPRQELYQQFPIPLPLTPTLQPTIFPPLRTQPLQTFTPAFPPVFYGSSPTDTVSTFDLSSPGAMTAAQMSQLQLAEEAQYDVDADPLVRGDSTAQDAILLPGLQNHQTAALRLMKAARENGFSTSTSIS
jgi:hypothetical protein